MTKECLHCGEPLERKRYDPTQTNPRGKLEPPIIFERRRYCDRTCASRGAALYKDWELKEELDFLLETDTPDSIAKRLGYRDIDSLANRLRKNGQTELLERTLALHEEYLDAAIR